LRARAPRARAWLRARAFALSIAFLDGRGSGGVTYRVETPLRAGDDRNATAVMTPYVEVCVQFDTCDGGAAYMPNESDPGVTVTVEVWANATTNATASTRVDVIGSARVDVIGSARVDVIGIARVHAVDSITR
jgi:hypothetical protein